MADQRCAGGSVANVEPGCGQTFAHVADYVCKMHNVSFSSTHSCSADSSQQSHAGTTLGLSPSAGGPSVHNGATARFWFGILISCAAVYRVRGCSPRLIARWRCGRSPRTCGQDVSSMRARSPPFACTSLTMRRRPLPDGRSGTPGAALLTRDVGPGELLASDAISAEPSSRRASQLPLLVPASGFPSNLAGGRPGRGLDDSPRTEATCGPAAGARGGDGRRDVVG